MRILQINSVCGIGSTGRIATDIHKMLIEQGHESYIAFGRGEPKNCENNIRIGNKYDVYSHVAKTRIFDKHGFGSKNATLEFIEKIKILDPDIIHLHNIHGYYINIEILFSYLKSANKPVVWTLHDCWAFTGHCAYFDYVGCDKWIKGCYNCPQSKEYPSSLLMDASSLNYSNKSKIFSGVKNLSIVTPSDWLKELVKISFLKQYIVTTINNGIDLEVFTPTVGGFKEKYKLKGEYLILGVANIWDRRKGFKYFLELSDLLQDDEKIVLVGLSDTQIQALPNNIIGIKRTSNIKELAEIYSSVDVFLNPTLEDNYPTTNLESLACGTPVVTFNTGGSVEVITKQTGIISKEKSSEALYDAIMSIRNSPTIYKSIVQNRFEYDKTTKFLEYIKLYSSMSQKNKY